MHAIMLGCAKPWAPHPCFGVKYGGFKKNLDWFTVMDMFNPNFDHIYSFDIDSYVKKVPKGCLHE